MQRRYKFSRALHFKLVQVHHRSRYLVREAGGVKKQQGKGGERAKYPLAKLYGALKLSERRKKKREFGEYQEFCRRRGRRRAGELLYIHEFVTSPGYLARPNFLPSPLPSFGH